MLEEERISIQKLQEYIQIPTVHPDVDYEKCIQFLENYAAKLSLPLKIVKSGNSKPIVIISWVGKSPELASIILNSHMDVAPVCKGQWTYDPFAAEIDGQRNIYGRGTQHAKSIGVQYLESIRRLKRNEIKLLRTVHMMFLPEIGGDVGMKALIQSYANENLKAGFALDEGHASPDDHYLYFNRERFSWQFEIICPWDGSTLFENSAAKKVLHVLNKIYEFCDAEMKKLDENSELSLGDITTMNVTMLNGGVKVNILPTLFTIVVDSKIAVTVDLEKFEETVNKWCQEAGEGTKINYSQKSFRPSETHLDEWNPYWLAFKKALDDKNLKSKCMILPGSSDGRYLREIGIPVIGFSPIVNTPSLAQLNDEHLNSKVFLNGIGIYYDILVEVGNVPKDEYLF